MTRRVMATVLATAALALLLFALPMAVAVQSRFHHDDVNRLEQVAASLSARAPGSPQLSEVPLPDDGYRYAVYDSGGQRVAGVGPSSADATVRAALSGTMSDATVGDELSVAHPITERGGVVGAVRVSEPVARSDARTRRAWAGMLALATVGLAGAGAAGRVLARRLVVPLDRLRASADRMGAGDFTAAVPAPAGIPEIDAVSQALRTSGDRIGRLIERERAFSAEASHELRTPIAAIRVAVEAELEAPRPDPTRILHDVLDATDRLATTVDDLLRLARDTQQQGQQVDLAGVLADLEARWRPRFAAADRAIHVTGPTDLAPVHASGAALSHALDVLVDNALRYADSEVTVAAADSRRGAVITVTDDGPGVADASTLFERRHPSASGAGIGLSLARTLVEAEGGRLRLRHAQPACFELTLAATDDGAGPLSPP